jgi:hypothetical protein
VAAASSSARRPGRKPRSVRTMALRSRLGLDGLQIVGADHPAGAERVRIVGGTVQTTPQLVALVGELLDRVRRLEQQTETLEEWLGDVADDMLSRTGGQ